MKDEAIMSVAVAVVGGYVLLKSNFLQNISAGIGDIGTGTGLSVAGIGTGLGVGFADIGGGIRAGLTGLGSGFASIGAGVQGVGTGLGSGLADLGKGLGTLGVSITESGFYAGTGANIREKITEDEGQIQKTPTKTDSGALSGSALVNIPYQAGVAVAKTIKSIIAKPEIVLDKPSPEPERLILPVESTGGRSQTLTREQAAAELQQGRQIKFTPSGIMRA